MNGRGCFFGLCGLAGEVRRSAAGLTAAVGMERGVRTSPPGSATRGTSTPAKATAVRRRIGPSGRATTNGAPRRREYGELRRLSGQAQHLTDEDPVRVDDPSGVDLIQPMPRDTVCLG